MVRRGDMKLIHYLAAGKYEMYNLKHDPLELHDLSQVTELARTLNELKADMRTIMRSMDDPCFTSPPSQTDA
ncbi:MAG: DUF4976 domain-containing protein [Pirellulaceae bacterium]